MKLYKSNKEFNVLADYVLILSKSMYTYCKFHKSDWRAFAFNPIRIYFNLKDRISFNFEIQLFGRGINFYFCIDKQSCSILKEELDRIYG